jgi:ubiquinone/menaquinone biosynthesis C-methylase UbiE
MNDYWNGIWANPDIEKYIGYVNGYVAWKPEFLRLFAQHGVKSVCDAACGFGAYSVMLAKSSYSVSGFDISDESVALTKKMLQAFDCTVGEYKVCGIINIEYDDASFDAVVAHAVIDHLYFSDAKKALNELYRILAPSGLLYLSFDPLSEEDISRKHIILEDGSRQYDDGLFFRHYTDEDIRLLIDEKSIVWSTTNSRGEREYVLQKSDFSA